MKKGKIEFCTRSCSFVFVFRAVYELSKLRELLLSLCLIFVLPYWLSLYAVVHTSRVIVACFTNLFTSAQSGRLHVATASRGSRLQRSCESFPSAQDLSARFSVTEPRRVTRYAGRVTDALEGTLKQPFICPACTRSANEPWYTECLGQLRSVTSSTACHGCPEQGCGPHPAHPRIRTPF